MDPEAPGVDHPLGDALVIEVEELLPEVEVLQKSRAPRPGPQAVLVIGDGNTLLGGERRPPMVGHLVGLAAAVPSDGHIPVSDLLPAVAILH